MFAHRQQLSIRQLSSLHLPAGGSCPSTGPSSEGRKSFTIQQLLEQQLSASAPPPNVESKEQAAVRMDLDQELPPNAAGVAGVVDAVVRSTLDKRENEVKSRFPDRVLNRRAEDVRESEPEEQPHHEMLRELVSTHVQLEDARCRNLRAAAETALAKENPNWAELAAGADVPVTTLRRWANALAAGHEVRRGRDTLMKFTEEQTLVGVILLRQSLNAPLTKLAVGRLANRMLRLSDPNNPRKFAHELPSNEWWALFLKRWPHLSWRKPSHLSAEALVRATKENLRPWFDTVLPLLRMIPQHLWHNMDEGQVRINTSGQLVLVARGEKHVHAEQQGYSGHVSIVPCVSATGKALPTMWVFQGSRAAPELLRGAGPEDAVAVTQSGWMTSKLFLKYLEWLDQHLPKERPCVLLVDQHESRFNLEALEFAASKNIIILALPARLTWLLQPLDLGVFRTFKSALADELALHGAQLSRQNFLATIYPAFLRAFTAENILAGWRASGLWPYNPSIVLDCSEVTKSELRKQYLDRVRKYVKALSSSSSSSSSASSSSSSSAALALPSPAAAARDLVAQPDQPAASSEPQASAAPLASAQPAQQSSSAVQQAWQIAEEIAPIGASKTRKRKQRGLSSGAQLTAREFIDSLAANPPKESKRDQSAAIWAPGQPHPPKRRAKAASQSKAKSDEDKADAKAAAEPVEPSAKVKRKPLRSKRIVDDEGDSSMAPAPPLAPESAALSQSADSIAGGSSSASSSSSSNNSSNSSNSSNSNSSDGAKQDAAGECARCQLPCLPTQNTRTCDGCTLLYHVECGGWPLKSSRRKQRFECPACKESKEAETEARRPRKRART